MLSIAGVEIEDVVDYDVAFARFGPALLAAPAHSDGPGALHILAERNEDAYSRPR
jgi:hypothetical protein